MNRRQLINLPANSTDIYESLRNQVLKGAAQPQGLSVVLYHGVLRGLQILAMKPVHEIHYAEKHEITKHSVSVDSNLVRLLANMVLHTQREILHGY